MHVDCEKERERQQVRGDDLDSIVAYSHRMAKRKRVWARCPSCTDDRGCPPCLGDTGLVGACGGRVQQNGAKGAPCDA